MSSCPCCGGSGVVLVRDEPWECGYCAGHGEVTDTKARDWDGAIAAGGEL